MRWINLFLLLKEVILLLKIRKFYERRPAVVLSFPRVVDEYRYDTFAGDLVKVGSKDIVAFVNAPARDTLLITKIQRYLAGDLLALDGGNAKGIYTDISGMPSDYNTIRNSLKTVDTFVKSQGFASVADFLKDFKNKSQSATKVNVDNVAKESEVVSDVTK